LLRGVANTICALITLHAFTAKSVTTIGPTFHLLALGFAGRVDAEAISANQFFITFAAAFSRAIAGAALETGAVDFARDLLAE